MPTTSKSAKSGRFAKVSKNSAKPSTKLHSIMLEAKRIRLAHASGELSAEEAAKQLAKLYNIRRFKSYRKSGSLLSA